MSDGVKTIHKRIRDRLREGSTWGSIAAIAAAGFASAKGGDPTAAAGAATNLVAALLSGNPIAILTVGAGLAGVLLPDRGK